MTVEIPIEVVKAVRRHVQDLYCEGDCSADDMCGLCFNLCHSVAADVSDALRAELVDTRGEGPTPMPDELVPNGAVRALREAIYTVLGDDCSVAETDAIIDLAFPAVVHALVDELAAQAKQDDAQIREANRMLAALRAELAEARAEIERLMGINKGLVRDFNTMLVSNSKAETARDGLRHQREAIRAALDQAVSEMECIRADRQTDYATGAVSGAQRARVRVLAVLARSDSVGGTPERPGELDYDTVRRFG